MSHPYDKLEICGKDVYIVSAHHFVLLPWSEIRRTVKSAPTLITLDHHTDTMVAFRGHRSIATDGNWDEAKKMLPALVDKIDWSDDRSILEAVSLLRHDEHIHAAVLSGIISLAFAINLSDRVPSIEEERYAEEISRRFALSLEGIDPGPDPEPPTPPYTYAPRSDGMFTISADCAIGCEKMPHDDECAVVRADQVLESFYLDHELATANRMANAAGLNSVEAAPYILDIDLDYFYSEKAIEPNNPVTFYRLIRNAVAITIALEPGCVRDLRCEGSTVTASSLLEGLKAHIEKALA
jgi:hypothetical protein